MKGFNPTRKELEEKKKAGKIAGFVWPLDEKGNPVKAEISREKKWINVTLHDWGMKMGYVIETEYLFAKDIGRKWRFDWAIKEKKIAIEYNGVFSKKSRHLTATGHTGDIEKINMAQDLGWIVWQFTPLNYKDLPKHLDKI